MNLTIPQPSLEPLLYFVTHGLLVMASAAVIFFTLGLWFGWLTWARHKRRARAFQEETTLLRHEIASLKRRIAEEAVDAPSMVPIGDDAQAAISPAPAAKESEGLAVAVLASVAAPLAPMAMPDSIQALAAHGATGLTIGATTSTDSAATASYHVPVVAPPNPEPRQEPAPALEILKPKTESTTILLPAPSRETTSIKLEAPAPALPASASITGQIQLPPLPELVEIPAEQAATPEAGSLFAAELAAGTVRLDPGIGIVYATRPERWDDLTLLRGVGEVLQSRLHDLGIFTFKQIAVWTAAQVQEIARIIEAKDRIQRDYWVQQASELHYLKYGEKLED